MQAKGKEYPQIWHMFAFRTGITDHLARFTQEIMQDREDPRPAEPTRRRQRR
jgi:hypothetical protein